MQSGKPRLAVPKTPLRLSGVGLWHYLKGVSVSEAFETTDLIAFEADIQTSDYRRAEDLMAYFRLRAPVAPLHSAVVSNRPKRSQRCLLCLKRSCSVINGVKRASQSRSAS